MAGKVPKKKEFVLGKAGNIYLEYSAGYVARF